MQIVTAFSPHRRLASVWAALALLLISFSSIYATPVWTPQQIADEYRRSHAVPEPLCEPSMHHGRITSLDDIAYFQHYRMLCDFLVSLQYTGAGPNHGGMIEAESEQSIIETDNTQEAIREWSQYAIWTGDTATYGPRIRLAQGYLMLWPAWHEDQEGGFYYGAHNCGWGFEAVAKYRQAYSDTSWNWYADSCANWTVAHPAVIDTITSTLGQLDPLAEGLAVGGLYPHSLYRQRADWQTFAVRKGRSLRRWFEVNPARLNNNEVWALCGGTALWGVCESLFAEYPDSGQTWITQYGPQLRVWTSNGTWNHSANAWYCNAQNKCFELTSDSLYWNHAVYITDSLIGLDLDHDGGIPPGISYPQTDDASWVSSYMGWMGMERIINHMPCHDVAARGLVSPNPLLPHLAGDRLVVSAHVVNDGMVPQSAWVQVSGTDYSDSTQVLLPAGVDSVVTLVQRWMLPDDSTLPPRSPLLLRVTAAMDDDSTNDTLTVAVDIRRGVDVTGTIRELDSQAPVVARVEFYHEGYPDSAWAEANSLADGSYSNGNRRLMAGTNTIRVLPPLQLMEGRQTVNLVPGSPPQQVDFALPGTQLALIDDSPGDTLERFYQTALDSFPLRVRTSDVTEFPDADFVGIPTVIWFTGNATNTIDEMEQLAIMDYVLVGGHLILSGQNIPDDTATTIFLRDVLHCSPHNNNTNLRRVFGSEDDSIFSGVDLYLLGQGGAQNQTSPASISVLPGSTAIAHFAAGAQDTCGVKGSFGDGRYIFLSVGLEAASGINNSTTRNNFLARCFDWFDNASYAEPKPPLPATISLSQNYPNPFNPSTTISFLAPRGVRPVRLVIYNLLGQKVRTLYDGIGTGTTLSMLWDGMSSGGIPVSSGAYVYRLQAGNTMLVRPLQLVR